MATSKGEEAGQRPKRKRAGRETFYFYSMVVFIGVVFCIEVALFNDVDISDLAHLNSPNRLERPKRGNGLLVGTRKGPKSPAKEVGLPDLRKGPKSPAKEISLPEYLLPHIPILPLFNSIPDAEDRITALLDGRATMAGVVALLQKFISELHDNNMEAAKAESDAKVVLDTFYRLAETHIKPFDDVYHGKHIFPLREDDSIFISLAAFREFYLLETLVSAFKNAKDPEKVFVGAVVQNCFGRFTANGTLDTSGEPCFTAKKTVGQDENGKDIKKALPMPPEKNGVEAFCAMPEYEQFCKNGQIRVLYMHHTDGQGPSMARYLASKLWGGENYFMQIDSHLRFADNWDAKYILDLKLTSNYPKSVLSSYPPGFEQKRFIPKHMNVDVSKINNETVIESPGCRLCHCSSPKKQRNPMIVIQQSKSYVAFTDRPKQQPFLGAGLIFTHGNFLRDIPYDPYLPWTFMGEEIVLSMRAWTHGWNMYAPRKNWIIHQYRPATLGLPKFYGSISGFFKKFGNAMMKGRVTRRMQHLVGYPRHTAEKIQADDEGFILVEIEKYGMGDERSRDDFIKFSEITIDNATGNLLCTKRLDWCMDETLE